MLSIVIPVSHPPLGEFCSEINRIQRRQREDKEMRMLGRRDTFYQGHNSILCCHHRRLHQEEGGYVNLLKVEGVPLLGYANFSLINFSSNSHNPDVIVC